MKKVGSPVMISFVLTVFLLYAIMQLHYAMTAPLRNPAYSQQETKTNNSMVTGYKISFSGVTSQHIKQIQ